MKYNYYEIREVIQDNNRTGLYEYVTTNRKINVYKYGEVGHGKYARTVWADEDENQYYLERFNKTLVLVDFY